MQSVRALGGAVLCTVPLSLLGTLGPPGSGLFLVAAPLAGLVLGGWYGQHLTGYCTVASGLLILAIGGPVHLALYLALVGLPTVAAVYTLQDGSRIERVIAATIGTLLVSVAVFLWASAGDLSTLRATFLDAWRQSFDQSIALYVDIGMSDDALSELEASRDELGQALLEVLPALAVLLSGALWLVALRLAGRWVSWPQTRSWQTWQTPPWLIWILIASGFALFLPVQELSIPLRNVFGVTLACYFCQGLAIVSYYLQRFGLPRGLRVASYLLIAIQQIVAGLVLILGIFDFWGDFRRLEPRPADASIGSDSD
jgi:uncharacterized protein YybS (DUF2232 family)